MKFITDNPTFHLEHIVVSDNYAVKILPNLISKMKDWIIYLSPIRQTRTVLEQEQNGLVITPLLTKEGPCFRVYPTQRDNRDDLTAIYNQHDGNISTLIVGSIVSPLRTAATVGVAIKILTPELTSTLAVIGCGKQALYSAIAIALTRPLTTIKVYCRNEKKLNSFASKLACLVSITTTCTENAQQAVENSDIIVLATSSKTPVVDTAWLPPHACLIHVGTKRFGSDITPDIYKIANNIVTDAPFELDTIWLETVLCDSGIERNKITSLSEAIKKSSTKDERIENIVLRTYDYQDGLKVFCSLGLAGTDSLVAKEVVSFFSDPK